MNEVGERSFNDMMGKYTSSVPFSKKESLDLNTYVTNRLRWSLLHGGQEEKKIRTDPAARVTDLLKNVFGK